uniref:Neuropathy target esterase sws n=1 Tax=Globodera rostochiensis TaxID=31243 RepID=A0A914HBH3_GLORO
MLWLIVLTIVLATIVLCVFCLRTGQSSSPAPSTEKESAEGAQLSTDANQSNPNVFKSIYSSFVRRKSLSMVDIPQLLQRRHSTVNDHHIPSQVANVAKSLFRYKDVYRRQRSIGVNREALPKPPNEFFEPNPLPEIPDDRFKPLTFLRQNLRILGFPPSCDINQSDIQVFIIEPREVVMKPGDPDDAIFVTLEGCLSVYITSPDASDKPIHVRRIEPGDFFFSPLSLIDILMGNPSVLKTVTLRAAVRTRLAKYSLLNFYNCYKQDPNTAAWVRPIQIIATRLLHVVLTTLHQQMGLGEELINKRLAPSSEKLRVKSRGQSLKAACSLTKPRLKRMSTEVEQQQPKHEQQIELAVSYYSEALCLSGDDALELIRPFVKLVYLEENQSLFEEGNSENPPALGVVVSGMLKLTQQARFTAFEDSGQDAWTALIHPKELIGGLQILTEEPAFYTVKGACQCVVALIEKGDVDRLIEHRPSAILPIAYSVLRRVSPFVRAVDFALGWVLLDSGEAVYRQGDFSESFFMVLSGRLRSVSHKVAIEEFGKGDVLGLVDVLQHNPRATTVLAVRYSQLARIPEGLLNFVKMQYPQVGFRLVRLLGQYYAGRSHFPTISHPSSDPLTQRNLHTIAVFPASTDVPLVSFTCELYHALSATTRVLRLSSKSVIERLGVESVMERDADFRLMHWLNAQEDTFQLLLYECDYTATNWTRRCLRQADAILVVAFGDKMPPEKHVIDDHLKMSHDGLRSRKELVLLWRHDVFCPKGTFEWLKGSWFSGHYHVRAPDRMFAGVNNPGNNEHQILEFYESNVFPFSVDIHGDFARLGRIISGNAVGLVLGGGGARGAAHVGVIRALRQNGVPIDMIGGTSIGSLVGGVLASNPYEQDGFEHKTHFWFMGMGSVWKALMDFTYGYVARFTGSHFNSLLMELFDEKHIEDLWLPYFCVTTDITDSEMRVHRTGPLWRYVRASMSLAVWLPPICDSEDGHYLLDGGYVNNLPADVMRSFGARTVIAVDVSSADDKDFHNYGDSVSGVWAQLRALNPWSTKLRILTGQEIQDRLAFVSSVRQLEMVKKAPYCNYLRPPIAAFLTMDFAKFETIKSSGYRYAAEIVPNLVMTSAHLKTLISHEKWHDRLRSGSVYRPDSRNNFHGGSIVDIAAQLSRIPPKHCRSVDFLNRIVDDDEEEEAGADDEADFPESIINKIKSSSNSPAQWKSPSASPTDQKAAATNSSEEPKTVDFSLTTTVQLQLQSLEEDEVFEATQ